MDAMSRVARPGSKARARGVLSVPEFTGIAREGMARSGGSLNKVQALRPRNGPHPGIHLFFVLEQIAQGRFTEHLVHRNLDGAPQGAHGAIHTARADGRLAGVAVAETAFENAPAERVHHVADDDGFRRTGQRVPALFAARRFDESALAEHPQDLGRVGGRNSLRLAHFGNRQGAAPARVTDADQAAQAVLFIGAQLHRRSLAMGMMSSIPIASLAASLMRAFVQGGSKVSSNFTPVTPGTARAARSTSAGRLPATGQLGAVSVMRMATCPASSTSTP